MALAGALTMATATVNAETKSVKADACMEVKDGKCVKPKLQKVNVAKANVEQPLLSQKQPKVNAAKGNVEQRHQKRQKVNAVKASVELLSSSEGAFSKRT